MAQVARPSPIKSIALTPPLKWAGGKRWLAPTIKKLYEYSNSDRLVEPFVGGMAASLEINPKQALLNDINPHLMNFYRQLQYGLISTVEMWNNRETFDHNRAIFNELILHKRSGSKEAAALFYYLNRTCFNGLCRFNSKGFFNVPFGLYRSIAYRSNFMEYQKIFKTWQFLCEDFKNIQLNASDFIYSDPPYDVEFTQYSSEPFGWKEQLRLAEWLAAHTGPVAASNQATERIIELYQSLGFDLFFLKAPRRISCNGSRTPAIEILALRNIF